MKTSKQKEHEMELAMNRAKRAELQEKINALKAKQISASKASDKLKYQAEIKALEYQSSQYPLRK
jgi:hypothetical protein